MLTKIENYIKIWGDWFGNAGALLLLVIFIISFVDIIGSKLFSWPVPGVIEIVGYFQAVFIALAAAITHILRQHIAVEIVASRLPKRAQVALNIFVSIFLLILFGLIVWQTLKIGITLQEKRQYSTTLRMPLQYFLYAMSVSFIVPCFAFMIDIANLLKELKNKWSR